jgi:putative copper export protein
MLRKLMTWAVLIFIAMWVISNPGHAGEAVHGWIQAIFTFMHSVS